LRRRNKVASVGGRWLDGAQQRREVDHREVAVRQSLPGVQVHVGDAYCAIATVTEVVLSLPSSA
jgi:hypothetical protein